jgi:hypothetical protein
MVTIFRQVTEMRGSQSSMLHLSTAIGADAVEQVTWMLPPRCSRIV